MSDESGTGTVDFIPMAPGDWGFLEFSRPKTANAVDLESIHSFEVALAAVPATVRLIVLRGSGTRAFISGGDIAAMRSMGVAEAAEYARAGQRLTRTLECHPAIIGAAVNGFALGGGTEIALACDVVTATASAVFGLPEVRLGILPGWGGTQRLVRAIGMQRGLRYLVTGSRFDGAEAERLGVVAACLADQDAAIEWWTQFADELRHAAPSSSAWAKRAARDGIEATIDAGLTIELGNWLHQFASDDRVEGMSAFLEKRPARWRSVGGAVQDGAPRTHTTSGADGE